MDVMDQFIMFKDRSGNKIKTRIRNIVIFIEGSSLERPSQMDPLAGSHRVGLQNGIQSVVSLETLREVQMKCGIPTLEH